MEPFTELSSPEPDPCHHEQVTLAAGRNLDDGWTFRADDAAAPRHTEVVDLAAPGLVTVTDRPPPTRAWGLTVPPWTAAIDATMVRPSPKQSRSLSRWWSGARASNAFRDRLAVNDHTWTRGRGWALWKALITLAQVLRTGSADPIGAAVRFGSRVGPARGHGRGARRFRRQRLTTLVPRRSSSPPVQTTLAGVVA